MTDERYNVSRFWTDSRNPTFSCFTGGTFINLVPQSGTLLLLNITAYQNSLATAWGACHPDCRQFAPAVNWDSVYSCVILLVVGLRFRGWKQSAPKQDFFQIMASVVYFRPILEGSDALYLLLILDLCVINQNQNSTSSNRNEFLQHLSNIIIKILLTSISFLI